ncbi:Hypothetical predicted protein [Mytilus galloprovincialis]|uniref:Uncharacterized protein n=1 Tax=Mytilus galloprovincialis TaxID=29158 RepID=A0A8B6ESC8_MYTGA|nr:Hypothetical predicted protein [Mytilus galloprovincialis]
MLFILYARTPFWMNIVAGPTISYFSIAMNIIIFVALFHKKIRSPTTIVMQGLALADGLTALCTYGFEPFFNLHYEEIGNSTSKLVTEGDFMKSYLCFDFLFKDKFEQYLIKDHLKDLNLLVVTEAVKLVKADAHALAVGLYCANNLQMLNRRSISFYLLRKYHHFEAFFCGIGKLLDSSFILGSSPYSEQMNYILNIASGHIDITLEHLKLLTEILKFSMIIGCGSNFLIYIIMSEKLRSALKKTFKFRDNQTVRSDAMKMQRRR